MKNIFITLLAIIGLSAPVGTFAQALQVAEDVESIPQNLYAARNPRTAANGKVCGVLFVHSTIGDLKFSGKVVGDVSNEASTYYVYLEPGTKKLEVYNSAGNKLIMKLPSVESKTTYQVTVSNVEERGSLSCASVPSGAIVEISLDNEQTSLGKTPIRGDIEIKSGTYTIVVSKPGYNEYVLNGVKIKPNKITNLGTIKLKK